MWLTRFEFETTIEERASCNPAHGQLDISFSSEDVMSKVVSCREVGVDCDFEARGETEQDVLQKCVEHARSAHGMDEIPPELASKVRSSIHDEEPRKQAQAGR